MIKVSQITPTCFSVTTYTKDSKNEEMVLRFFMDVGYDLSYVYKRTDRLCTSGKGENKVD